MNRPSMVVGAQRLHTAMKEHLQVHFDAADTSDDAVLGKAGFWAWPSPR
jgi:hypothetical protein